MGSIRKHPTKRGGPSTGFLGMVAIVALAVGILVAMPQAAFASGSIMGTVTVDGTTTALAGISVNFYRYFGQGATLGYGSVSTDASGTYHISGLTAAPYRVFFSDNANHDYASKAFGNASTIASGTDVMVADNATASADATMAPGGRITGMVSTAATGGPLPNMLVSALRFDPSFGTWQFVGSQGSADASGTYTIKGLAAGKYSVRFSAADNTYTAHFYNTTVDWPTAGQDVTASLGTTTTGINAAMAVLGPDAFEPDNDVAHATTVTVGQVYNRTLFPAAPATPDMDWHWFNAKVGQTYIIQTLATRTDTFLDLYGTNGTSLLRMSDDLSLGFQNSMITWTAPASGRYFFLVRGFSSGSRGAYQVSVTTPVIPQVPVTAKLVASPKLKKLGKNVRFSGMFSPAAGTAYRVASLQRLTKGKWVTVKSFRLNGSGKFVLQYREKKKGLYKYHATLPSTLGFQAGTSNSVAVRWH